MAHLRPERRRHGQRHHHTITGTNSQNSDDALRLELTNTGADPSVTGWHDYYFVTNGKTTAANDTVPNQ